jgi:hypothetical protein
MILPHGESVVLSPSADPLMKLLLAPRVRMHFRSGRTIFVASMLLWETHVQKSTAA